MAISKVVKVMVKQTAELRGMKVNSVREVRGEIRVYLYMPYGSHRAVEARWAPENPNVFELYVREQVGFSGQREIWVGAVAF